MDERPDSHLSCVVVHRSISSSHHEFMQAKLDKCCGLYESYFNPFLSLERFLDVPATEFSSVKDEYPRQNLRSNFLIS